MSPTIGRWIWTVILCIVGMLGNYVSIPLFFGVDFVFGSIAAFVAIAMLGTVPGILVAAAAGAYTIVLWGHPYAAIIFVLEICFVALVRQRINQLTLAVAFYWLLIGMPLVLAFYWGVLDLPHPLSTMIALKQAVNGILNCAAAMLIVITIRLLDPKSGGASLSSGLFNVMLVSILIPGIVLIALETRQIKSDRERTIMQTLKLVSMFATYRLRSAAPDNGTLSATQGQVILLDMLDNLPFDRHVNIGFLSDQDDLIASIGQVSSVKGGELSVSEDGVEVWLPERGSSSLMNWWQSAFYKHVEPVYHIGPIHSVLVEHSATQLVTSLHERNFKSFLILIVLTGFAIVIAIIVSNAFSVPLIQLGRASKSLADDIESGKSISVPKSHLEEVSTLASSFRAMASSLSSNFQTVAERTNQLESLSQQLAKYLSPQIYDSIFSGNQEVTITTERKKLTVFFSDLKDFTNISSELQPEDLTNLLNSYFSEMSRIATRHGATIDKFIGDAMVMFFGDPETRGMQEDARACVRMAIEMQARMKELAVLWRTQGYNQKLEMRIGINTGYCNVGNFGSDERMDYTIIGAEVNIAARLESAADPGGILLSHETLALVRDMVDVEERESIKMKGVRRKVRVFAVCNMEDASAIEQRVFRHEEEGLHVFIDPDRLSGQARQQARDKLKKALSKLEPAADSIHQDGSALQSPDRVESQAIDSDTTGKKV